MAGKKRVAHVCTRELKLYLGQLELSKESLRREHANVVVWESRWGNCSIYTELRNS